MLTPLSNIMSNAIARGLRLSLSLLLLTACGGTADTGADSAAVASGEWPVDFLDNFDSFDSTNWQDQRIWVNDEQQCYVPDGHHDTRVVSEGTLKLRVVNLGAPVECDVPDKFGKQPPPRDGWRAASPRRTGVSS